MDENRLNERFNKINKRIVDIEQTAKKNQKSIVDIINQTHQKIEFGDETLYNMIIDQKKIIDALITLLIHQGIIKDNNQINEVIESKDTMKELTKRELTEEEFIEVLQREANILYKLLYHKK